MKIKTSELIDEKLDYAVATAMGWGGFTLISDYAGELMEFNSLDVRHVPPEPDFWRAIPLCRTEPKCHLDLNFFRPSTRWAVGGPTIERERISVQIKHDGWHLACIYDLNDDMQHIQLGHGYLIAAMRCFVASKLGEEVEIPEELCK